LLEGATMCFCVLLAFEGTDSSSLQRAWWPAVLAGKFSTLINLGSRGLQRAWWRCWQVFGQSRTNHAQRRPRVLCTQVTSLDQHFTLPVFAFRSSLVLYSSRVASAAATLAPAAL
jgi:hypothetical protein